jgi:hypothetical protein
MAYAAENRVLAALASKSVASREIVGAWSRTLSRPTSVKARQKIAKSVSAWNLLSPLEKQACREAKALKRSRWLTNCIVIKNHQQVFDIIAPHDDGGKVHLLITLPENAALLELLLAIIRHPEAPLVMRLDAAKNAAVFMHPRKGTEVREKP